MGGYVFDVQGFNENTDLEAREGRARTRTRVRITSSGFRFLMEYDPDLIPQLSKASITDRSKSSSLGKALLLAQLVWFCANCATRLFQGLPLSLLEISTLTNGICSIAS